MRNGWFHTGDAAVVHPDGYVEIRDRFKDVIISGGENISSIEVEGVLLRASGGAGGGGGRHAAREMGRDRRRRSSCSRPGASDHRGELRALRRERLAHFKVPGAVHFVSELPKTATGKIQKYVLRQGRSAISRQ